jgi:prepilin-type N-terminal cleavage/methylation domain-containing protein
MRSKPNGFTLLELLIAMTLMALVMTTVLVGLRVASRAWQQGEDRLRLVYAEQERADFMAKQVASLVPYQVLSSDPKLAGQFAILEASPSCLRFLSTYGSHDRSGAGLILVEYGLVGVARGRVDLLLRETPVQDDGQLLHQIIQTVATDPVTGIIRLTYRPFLRQNAEVGLLRNLNAARFEYLDPDSRKGGTHWVSDWQPGPDAAYPLAFRFAWEQDGHQEQAVFPIRARSFPK